MPTGRHRAPGMRLPSARGVAALGLVAVAVLGVGTASASRLAVAASSGGVSSGVGTVTRCDNTAALQTSTVLAPQPNPGLLAQAIAVSGIDGQCTVGTVTVVGRDAAGATLFSSSAAHTGGGTVQVGIPAVPASSIATVAVVLS